MHEHHFKKENENQKCIEKKVTENWYIEEVLVNDVCSMVHYVFFVYMLTKVSEYI